MSYTDYPNVWLTTLQYTQDFIEGARSNWTTEKVVTLVQCIEDASAMFIEALERLPLPYADTMYADWSNGYVSLDSKTLTFYRDADLLAVTSISNGNGDSVTSSYYNLLPSNKYPKQEIALKRNNSVIWRGDGQGNWQRVISVTGIYGYVPHYANCWKSTGQTVQNTTQISASGVTLEVSDASGFSRGDYLQIEDETVFVEATDTDSNELTIVRGELGTSASAHANNTAITRFVQRNDIKNAVTRWASYLYKTKDKVGEDLVTFDGVGNIPRGLDPSVKSTVLRHRKLFITES